MSVQPGQRHFDRLLARVAAGGSGCWSWPGSLNHAGYGLVWDPRIGRMAITHRVAYEVAFGAISPGLTLDHLCRNRACMNPAHLEPVTLAENCQRGAAARRAARELAVA